MNAQTPVPLPPATDTTSRVPVTVASASEPTPAKRVRSMRPWILWAAVVIVIDQITKSWILQNYQLYDATPITSFFNIVRAHNTGAAFSFMAGGDGWQRWMFVGIASAATVFIVWQLYRNPGQRLMAFALSSILGGAIGNVVDRLMHGYVVDFLDFFWAGRHFPAFNVADSAITLGAICLVIDEILRMRRARAAVAG